MTVRSSLARLERSAVRVFGEDTSPCKCRGPLLVIYNEKAGTVEGDTGDRCESCGRERVRINVQIIDMHKAYAIAGVGSMPSTVAGGRMESGHERPYIAAKA